MSLDIHYFHHAILKNPVRKMDEWVFNKFLWHFTIMVFLTMFFHTQIYQFHSNFFRLYSYFDLTFIGKLPYAFGMIYFNSYYCSGLLFHSVRSNSYMLYTSASTIISLTIYTWLVFQLYHINFVSYLLYPLRFDIIVNRQFCLKLFQCCILIINMGYSLKNHPINRQSRSCSTVLSVFYDSITRPPRWKK